MRAVVGLAGLRPDAAEALFHTGVHETGMHCSVAFADILEWPDASRPSRWAAPAAATGSWRPGSPFAQGRNVVSRGMMPLPRAGDARRTGHYCAACRGDDGEGRACAVIGTRGLDTFGTACGLFARARRPMPFSEPAPRPPAEMRELTARPSGLNGRRGALDAPPRPDTARALRIGGRPAPACRVAARSLCARIRDAGHRGRGMARLVTIYGGSGFVGRYIARRMAKAGWRVRVAVRRPNEAIFVRPYGTPGQVEPVACNIRDEASVRAAMAGVDAVVNCVGILVEEGRNRFDAVQAEGAGRIARIAAETGVGRLVHISAIGADASSDSHYARTKAAGEAAVTAAFPGAVILRPSIVFGPEDQFFNRFAAMARLGPFLPVVGAETRFQPVYVDDVAAAAEKALTGDVAAGVYELGGPEVLSFRALMLRMLEIIRRRRIILNVPFFAARIMAFGLDALQLLTLGLWTNRILTRDQVRNLARDNVVSPGARGLADLGITPTPMAAVLPDYLWRYRPAGQFTAIQESARNLRD
jgi:NADH dehydrogenase